MKNYVAMWGAVTCSAVWASSGDEAVNFAMTALWLLMAAAYWYSSRGQE